MIETAPIVQAPLAPFDKQSRTRLVFGNGTLARLGELAAELEKRRVLLVTDRGIVAAGHADHARQILEKAGLRVATYGEATENPTTLDVAQCVEVARAHQADLLVGLGGGSSMDTAKGCNFIYTNGGVMSDYWGVNKARQAMLPLIAIPTTAGTGSECQSAALIADEQTHLKMACLDTKVTPRIAILDPELTVSQPQRVTTCAGIDAVAHAVETAVTTRRHAISTMYSREAFKLCVTSLPRVLANPRDLDARGRMLLGAALAGTAIEQSMLGAAHSAANPLTAHFGIAHGQAVGMLLPLVVAFNGEDPAAQLAYAELASAPEIACVSEGSEFAWRALIARLEALLNLAGIPRSLADCGVRRELIPTLADEAARQWTANFNPRRMTVADFVKLYEAAFVPRGEGDGAGE
ncbi:MAG TPA: iron-containing alcohol dehydrogenase [Verrucomicrobiae bacterium]|nr:iron-containing alcohol dehydrogenase [Verrucomicrobiae bacterium]